jgi:phosphatidylserine decarboxylase
MKSPNSAVYVDRRTGERKRDPIYKRDLLDWLYNSAAGWLLTRLILSRKIVSQSYAWLNRRRSSARKIPGFIEAMGVNMEESLRSPEEFNSFNDFVTRRIDMSQRSIAQDPDLCVAPADGRILAFPVVDDATYFALKHCSFSLRTLLCDDELAKRYTNGSLVISRLYLADYHHFHFADDGIPHEPVPIAGRYYATTPYSRRWIVPFFAENCRTLTLFDSEHFGRIAIVEVGAFTVGSIKQCFRPGVRVCRGDHKGFFELGGSVVALLFESGAIALDQDLCDNTCAGLETFVRLGESIGRVGPAAHSCRRSRRMPSE